ncbi:MAG TPA: dirigent protein [Devosia sp.]|jgi:hypothetical protein|nr:dirigent protein [Devosia sp.]
MKSLPFAAALSLFAVAAPVTAAETLRFDVAFHDQLISARTDALSVGDRVIINDDLLTDGEKVGTAAGLCTITDTAVGLAICNVSFVLPGGSLSVQFVNSPPPEKTFAILGGTGDFAGATGSGTLIENGDETGSVEFVLD